MGDLLGGAGEFFGFSGGDAGASAAGLAQQQNQLAIQALQRQFGATQQNLDPFIQAGIGQLGALEQGTTAGGLDERFAAFRDTDIFGTLTEEQERATLGGLGATGLTRSGAGLQQLAQVPTNILRDLEQQTFGRSQELAGAGQQAALGLGGIGGQAAGGIANLFQSTGQTAGAGAFFDEKQRAAANQNIIRTAASIFFSDPALKENVVEISQIKDLKVYQWDWIPETKGTIVEGLGTVGFMGDEVKEKYPHHVGEFGGFMVIDYPGLLNELEAA